MCQLRKAHDSTFDGWIRLSLLIVAFHQLLYIAETGKWSTVLYMRESGDLLAKGSGGTFEERGEQNVSFAEENLSKELSAVCRLVTEDIQLHLVFRLRVRKLDDGYGGQGSINKRTETLKEDINRTDEEQDRLPVFNAESPCNPERFFSSYREEVK